MKSLTGQGSAAALRFALALCVGALLAGCAATDAPRATDVPRATGSEPEGAHAGQAQAPRTDPAGVAAHPHVQLRQSSTGENGDALPPNELTPQILYQILASEVAAQRGQVGTAAATYLSLARQTKDPRLARRATELALAERSLDRALDASRTWHELAPGSARAAQTYETLLLTTGNIEKAEPLLAARLAKARADDGLAGFYRQLQRTLSRVPDRRAALALFDRISAQDAAVPEARTAAAELAHGAGLNERAAEEAKRALALRPDDEDLAVDAARLVRDTPGGADAAMALLKGFLERDPKATEARFSYARLLAGAGRTEEARVQMELALRDEPESPPILFSLAQIAYQGKQLDVAEGYLKRYLALPRNVPRDNGPAYLFLAQIEEDRGHLPQAIDWLAQVTRGDQFVPALLKRALLLGRSGQVDQARQLLHDTEVSTLRERVQLVAAESQVLREAKRYEEAFEVIDKALQRMPDNPDLLYDHAMAAERLDRVDVMEASLRKLIELRPDSAHAYNALGYSLADRNLRLDEAQKLIEKALELAPDDAHILDSMGWVLYRKGQYEQALDYLQRAFKLRPDAEIAAHLGEVLWRLGRNAEARELWNGARLREPDNEVLKETLARLNVSL